MFLGMNLLMSSSLCNVKHSDNRADFDLYVKSLKCLWAEH